MGDRKMHTMSAFSSDKLAKKVNEFYKWCRSKGYTVFDVNVAASGWAIVAYISYGPPEKR